MLLIFCYLSNELNYQRNNKFDPIVILCLMVSGHFWADSLKSASKCPGSPANASCPTILVEGMISQGSCSGAHLHQQYNQLQVTMLSGIIDRCMLWFCHKSSGMDWWQEFAQPYTTNFCFEKHGTKAGIWTPCEIVWKSKLCNLLDFKNPCDIIKSPTDQLTTAITVTVLVITWRLISHAACWPLIEL